MAIDPVIQQHLAEKISGETKYLARKTELLEAELSDRKREKGFFDKIIASQGWGWFGVVLTLAVTSFGFFETLSNYFEREANRNAFALDKDMIAMVANSSSEAPVERAKIVNLLSYYEYNSLPVIVYLLEKETSEDVRKEIEKSLIRITLHARDKDKIICEVISSFEVFATMDSNDDNRFYNFKTYLHLFRDDIFKDLSDEDARNSIVDILKKLRTKYSKDSVKYERYLKELEDSDIEKFK